jgi:hypothetical protein
MVDNNFAFIQAVFHVIVFILIHGSRSQRGTRVNSNQRVKKSRDASKPTINSVP